MVLSSESLQSQKLLCCVYVYAAKREDPARRLYIILLALPFTAVIKHLPEQETREINREMTEKID
jgi:hypothetical protein